jgi:hypothetical protein
MFSGSFRLLWNLAVAAAIVCLLAGAASAVPGETSLVSVSSAGVQGRFGSAISFISDDGRYVLFTSTADNLTLDDLDSVNDVFVRDLVARTTALVSVSSSGVKGNRDSTAVEISAEGRYVVFSSTADNLVPNDTNRVTGFFLDGSDIFVRDRVLGTTERVNVSSAGAQAEVDSASEDGDISADGRFVVFKSFASNLVANDGNGWEDIFVRDRLTATTRRVSVSSGGGEANGPSLVPSISADGRFVVFNSHASNLVANDANGTINDVFVHDLQTGTTSLVSVSSTGVQGNSSSLIPSVSADGRYVAFTSFASNLVSGDTNNAYDVFVRDRQTGTTARVSVSGSGAQGNHDSAVPDISPDGRFLSFQSVASNLVPNDANGLFNDVFVRDRQTGTTQRVSVSSLGLEGNESSHSSSISADGRLAAFQSFADNLVLGDVNDTIDVFVHERGAFAPPPPDTTPPQTTITAGPAGEVASSTATFEFTSSESPSSFECSLDGAAFANCSSPTSYTGLGAGAHSFGVRATDGAGNTDPTPAQRSWTVIACTITGTEGADRLTGTAGDDVVCALGGNDEIDAAGGDDTVLAGAGDDKVLGRAGADTLRGGTGRDELNGDDGDDALFGDEGFDKLNGGLGSDSCDAGPDGGETANCSP